MDTDLAALVQNHLNEGKTEELLGLFKEDRYQNDITNKTWELISAICKHLNQDVKVNNVKVFECCAELINCIAVNSPPEEAILQFIEEIEIAKDDVTFFALLEPLQILLSRVPNKHQHSLAWCFNALQSYLDKLKLPRHFNLENDERNLIEADPTVDRITYVIGEGLLPFYESFLPKLKSEELDEGSLILSKFVIKLFDKPFALLDLECVGSGKSRARRISERICEDLIQILPDPVKIVEIYDENKENAVCQAPDLALGVMFYLIYGEGLLLERIPQIYDPVYVFHSYLHVIPELLDNNHQFLISKGLKLIQAFLDRLKGLELSYLLLDSENHCRFCKQLAHVVIYNSTDRNRRTALKIFEQYLNNFETRGRYLLVYNLVNVVNHTGLIGFFITYYKNILNHALNTQEENLSDYFKGQKLFTLLQIFCHLHKGEQSDLIELADQIISSLNLLRYLVLRDKRNVTKIWDYIKILERNYLAPLKKGLMLSRAHYEIKMQDMKAETAKGDTKQKMSKVSVTVAGESLPDMQVSDKMKALQSALIGFDVMESILGRLTELIDARALKE